MKKYYITVKCITNGRRWVFTDVTEFGSKEEARKALLEGEFKVESTEILKIQIVSVEEEI